MQLREVKTSCEHYYVDENNMYQGEHKVWAGGDSACPRESGKLIHLYNYTDGQLDNESLHWNPDGQMVKRVPYLNCKLHGTMQVWHNNGQLSREVTYRHGRANGVWREWYDNGQLSVVKHMVDDNEHGMLTVYEYDGRVSRRIYFDEGRDITSSVFSILIDEIDPDLRTMIKLKHDITL